MKLIINYDFFNAIKDVNEGFTPMKIVRNNKKEIAYLTSSFFMIDYLLTRNGSVSLKLLLIQSLGFFVLNYAYKFYYEIDPYKEISSSRLKKLVLELKDLYINTNYDLLIGSELQEKKYKIHLNELKIPELLENKYILVPNYDISGKIKYTSILQEHVVGTNEYTLSIGSPKKELKLVYSKS